MVEERAVAMVVVRELVMMSWALVAVSAYVPPVIMTWNMLHLEWSFVMI